jgi:hypothetical protein
LVREIVALEKATGGRGPMGALRRPITDAEIEEILGSENIEIEALDHIEQIDLMEPLDRDEYTVQQMLRIAGRGAKTLETDHFVLAYTSSTAKARALARRLEAVYKWSVKFMEMMEIPPVRPKSKLEIFFFATHKEFDAYSALHGFREMGVLGFYHHVDNRCAFFDMMTWPPVAMAYEKYQNPDIDYQTRRRKHNLIERFVEHMNLEVIQHEAGHQIHFNIGIFPLWGDVPTWVVEGLTMQFETPPSKLGASFGTINYPRLEEIRRLYGPRGENLPPMRDFILHDSMWHAGGAASYPIGWALVRYLYKTQREEFAEFMRLLAERENDRGVRVPITEKLGQLEEIFGKLDDEWIQGFKDYIGDMTLRTSVLPPTLQDIQ